MTLSVHVERQLGEFQLDARFKAPAGVTAIFGRSGAGKTSLTNAVAGLIRPDAGRVAIDDWVLFDSADGRWLPPNKRRLGYVFQESRLFPHMNVRQNLLYGRWLQRSGGRSASFDDVVEMLDIGPLLTRRPDGLSGGERQRIAIGRALLANPRLLLMDEPLANLDDARKAEILPYIERLRDAATAPVIYVSHQMGEIARLATTVVALDAGRVTIVGPADVVLADPDAAPALGLREAGAILRARVAGHHSDGLSELSVAAGRLFLPRVAAAAGAELRVRIHANDVILSRALPEGLSALNVLPAKVVAVREGTGPGALVQLAAGSDRLLARITRRSAAALELEPGADCFAIVKSVAVAQGDVTPAP